MRHYISIYRENGELYAESWLQVNILSRAFCFWRKRLKVQEGDA